MKKTVLSIFSCSLLFILNSCHTVKTVIGNSTNSVDTLYKYQWNLTDLEGKPFYSEPGREANLIFEKATLTRVFGSTGCNRLSGTVNFNGASLLKFSPFVTTRMACPGDNESRFLQALSSVNNWVINDNQLLLNNEKTLVAKLTGISKELSSALSGTWQLNYVSGLKVPFDSMYREKKPYISFNLAANEISGNTSCNGFTSKYKIDGSKINFQPGLQTMMFCEGGGEEAFLDVLKKVNGYAVHENTLTFLMGDIAVMRFER